MSKHRGFTLIEILIVIGVLAVLSTATALIINPVDMLAQARDSKRVTEIDKINRALDLFQVNLGQPPAQNNIVYISLPDSSPTCLSHTSLPILASGWSYACATIANHKKTDGTGWIPVNFSNLTQAAFDELPVDPKNNIPYYYTYIPGRLLTAGMESRKFLRDFAATDEGVDTTRYEKGNVQIGVQTGQGPTGHWRFNETSGSGASDSSGNNNNGTVLGATWNSNCKVNGCLNFDGVDDRVSIPNQLISSGIQGPSTVVFWFKSNNLSGVRKIFTDNCLEWGVYTNSITLSGQVYAVSNISGIQVGRWYLIALVHDHPTGLTNTRIKLYQDGTYVNEVIRTITTENGYYKDNPYHIGADGCGTTFRDYFSGHIDEFRIYGRALSELEIESIYLAER